MAKPTPWIRSSSGAFPFQKMVYPEPSSVMLPSPGSLVSLRAATSMLKRSSSLHTSAVRLSGRSVFGLSCRVRMFHAPSVKCLAVGDRFPAFVFLEAPKVFRPHEWEVRQPRCAGQTSLPCPRFAPPFLGASPCGVGCGGPKKASPVVDLAAELCCHGRVNRERPSWVHRQCVDAG